MRGEIEMLLIHKYLSRLRAGGLWLLVFISLLATSQIAIALPGDQKKIYDSGIPRFNIVEAAPVACSPGSGGGSLVGSDNAEKVWNFLRDKGLTPEQAAGVMGNLKVESGFDPFNQENSQSWPNGGWGIAQWTGGRRDTLSAAVIAELGAEFYVPTEEAGGLIGTPAEDQLLNFQLNYLYDESNQRTMRDDPNTIEWVGLTRLTVPTPYPTPEEAVEASVIYWEYNFERAGVPALGTRLDFANDILAQFGSGTTTPTTGGGCAALSADGCPTSPVDQSQMVDVQGISVHPCISAEVERILNLAHAQGYDMSGSGWRSVDQQIQLRIDHGCGGDDIYNPDCNAEPPTAVPGTSRHESGTAVDFTCDGVIIAAHSDPCFQFLASNTALKNLSTEPWHWSIDGG